jgi:Holliday junction resolvasome RuvABC DNA-binding subunit
MIGRLSGVLLRVEENLALIEVGGVGYEVRLPPRPPRAAAPRLAKPITLHIPHPVPRGRGHPAVRLSGACPAQTVRPADYRQRGSDRALRLNLMGAGEPDALARAIARKDTRYLKSLPGVGAKLAERLALELSDKVAQFAFERQVERLVASARASAVDLDALTEGLVQLGYARRDAQAALNAALTEQPDADEQTLMRLAPRPTCSPTLTAGIL